MSKRSDLHTTRRQAELRDGVLVVAEYSVAGRRVRETYYCGADGLLKEISSVALTTRCVLTALPEAE
jgi:hypothetical protein